MPTTLSDALKKLPLAANAQWPDGRFDVEIMAHGTMRLEIFAPRGIDRQTPHVQDELYLVVSGNSMFNHKGERRSVSAGDAIFVRAGDDHRFEEMSDDFVTWVIFWGPDGGEAPAPHPSVFAEIDA